MALITFRDSRGVHWRVWNVSRETLGGARSSYLGSEFQNGWLVFQREGSDERRRLSMFPDDWATLAPEQLEAMCRRAQVVSAVRANGRAVESTHEVPRYER